MANTTIELNWVTLLECKQCKTMKEVNNENWYKHSAWYMWVLWRCKECIKTWRKIDHELSMSRKRDAHRYKNNQNRRRQIYRWSGRRRIEKWYWAIHWACSRLIKKLWIRPTTCSVCLKENNRIEAHHFNYMFPFKVIFCCKVCHSKLDRWLIDYRIYPIVDIEPSDYKSKVTWIDHKINTTWSCM